MNHSSLTYSPTLVEPSKAGKPEKVFKVLSHWEFIKRFNFPPAPNQLHLSKGCDYSRVVDFHNQFKKYKQYTKY